MERVTITETRTNLETGEEIETVTRFDLLSAFTEIQALRKRVQELEEWQERMTGDHK
jgi:hypothetical protein